MYEKFEHEMHVEHATTNEYNTNKNIYLEKGPSPPFSWTNPHQTNQLVFVLRKKASVAFTANTKTPRTFVSEFQYQTSINNNQT